MSLSRLLAGEELSRQSATLVLEAFRDTRVVALQGARQVGKSTLARAVLASRPGGRSFSLDDPLTRSAAEADPSGFLSNASGTMLIDEVHRVPELVLAIKASVDRDPRPGRFLLTGSAHLLSTAGFADSLAGRVEFIDLWPFTQGELRDGADGFVREVFAGEQPRLTSELGRRDYIELIAAGGFPEALRRVEPGRRSRWYASYVKGLVHKDLPEIARIDRLEELPRLLRMLASRTAQSVSADSLAAELGITANTVRRYIGLLEAAYLVTRLPPWSRNETSRMVKSPKLHFVDSGLCAYLRGVDVRRLEADPGAAIESFVVMELLRQASWMDEPVSLSHLRTRDGVEVDVVLETLDGRVFGVEAKAGATVRAADFRGLRHLATEAGDRFIGGVVLHTGPDSLPFGPNLSAVPIEALWRTA